MIEGKFVPQLDEATEIVDDVPLDTGYFGTFGDATETEIKPLTMNRGYINVENPLLIDSDMAGWEAERLLTDGGDFNILFEEQLLIDDINLTPFQDDMLDDLYARAEYITETMYTEIFNTGVGTQASRPSNVYEALKSDLIRAEFNIDFREFLQDLGYDSIKYKNEVETSLKGESNYSYILFKPDQFIPVVSKLLDDEADGAKAAFAEGGVASYEIQTGDTLSSIARQRGTTVEQACSR